MCLCFKIRYSSCNISGKSALMTSFTSIDVWKQSSQIDFKLFLALSFLCPWGCMRLCNKIGHLWQVLATTCNSICAILILLSFSFSTLHAGVLWPSLLSFTLRSPHRAVLMFELLSLWRMRLSSSFSVVLLSSEHYKATQRWHLCWIFKLCNTYIQKPDHVFKTELEKWFTSTCRMICGYCMN